MTHGRKVRVADGPSRVLRGRLGEERSGRARLERGGVEWPRSAGRARGGTVGHGRHGEEWQVRIWIGTAGVVGRVTEGIDEGRQAW